MPVVFDTSFLIHLLDAEVGGRGEVKLRLQHLLKTLDQARTKVVVPTPALCEVLIGAGDAVPACLDHLTRSPMFRIVPFDTRAAVEAAAAHRAGIRAGDKKEGGASWATVKYDRQILSIAKVAKAECIYSDDEDIHRLAALDGMDVVALAGLPPSPLERQGELPLGPSSDPHP